MYQFQKNTLKYLFKGNAFRNEVEDEDSPLEEDESNDLLLTKDAKGINIFFKYIIVCDKTLKSTLIEY